MEKDFIEGALLSIHNKSLWIYQASLIGSSCILTLNLWQESSLDSTDFQIHIV